MGETILRKADIKRITGLSDVSIRAMEAAGQFPRRFVINPNGRQVGWLESEIEAWVEARANSRNSLP